MGQCLMSWGVLQDQSVVIHKAQGHRGSSLITLNFLWETLLGLDFGMICGLEMRFSRNFSLMYTTLHKLRMLLPSMVDHMEIPTQVISTTCDWEIDTFTAFFSILFSTMLRQKSVDKCFEPLPRQRCSMSHFSYNFSTPYNNPFHGRTFGGLKPFHRLHFLLGQPLQTRFSPLVTYGKDISQWLIGAIRVRVGSTSILFYSIARLLTVSDFLRRISLAWVLPRRILNLFYSWRGLDGAHNCSCVENGSYLHHMVYLK